MLDINFIRNNPDVIKADLKRRYMLDRVKLVDDLIMHDDEWRRLKQESDRLRHKRNVISEEINRLVKERKDASLKIQEVKALPERIKQIDARLDELRSKIDYILLNLPNILDKSVPIGKDASQNKVIRKWGKIKKLAQEIKPHGELIEELGVADFKNAAKVAGSGFVYLKGNLALLDLALQRFAIDFLMKKGFTLVEPPFMLNKQAYQGVTDLAAFHDVLYKIENEDLYLIATSEHPIVALHKDDIFNKDNLPVRYAGISPCFRKEIGSHGVDTRGLFRIHQFNKVEQVVFCFPKDSNKLLDEIQKNSEQMLQKLGIPYRVVAICSADIGMIAAKKYDIEAWFPREQEYKEVTSASNCTNYQAVSLNIKFKSGEDKDYVHTLNNTGIATSRTMRAIIEHYQLKDGSIKIPAVLKKYMNGISKIEGKI